MNKPKLHGRLTLIVIFGLIIPFQAQADSLLPQSTVLFAVDDGLLALGIVAIFKVASVYYLLTKSLGKQIGILRSAFVVACVSLLSAGIGLLAPIFPILGYGTEVVSLWVIGLLGSIVIEGIAYSRLLRSLQLSKKQLIVLAGVSNLISYTIITIFVATSL